eukprot:TRINITY_DN553_c0_g4_i1.p1 TRINITY_DN553_c0_g4~~TRINITY_DN553_c0_g4_i1.p1  ORF type:complete len:435 (+),score=146.83 TRINITY_DN553_c0_g4_i1:137-1441(+)
MKSEVLYKVIFIGDVGVGKTSILKRHSKDKWVPNTKPTIGVDFILKEMGDVVPNTHVRLQLWDIGGQERFKNLTRVYYKEAAAAVVVFDLTAQSTLDGVVDWKWDLDEKVAMKDGTVLPCLLLANKADLDNHIVAPAQLDAMVAKHNFAAWFATSALTNEGIQESLEFLVKHVHSALREMETSTRRAQRPGALAASGPQSRSASQSSLVSGNSSLCSLTQSSPTPPRVVNLRSHPAAAPQTPQYKILLTGLDKAGKASFVRRFVDDRFTYKPNNWGGVHQLREDVLFRVVQLRDFKAVVHFCIVPSQPSGGGRGTPNRNEYYRGAHGAVVIADATNTPMNTIHSIEFVKTELEAKCPTLPCVLVINKCDHPQSHPLAADVVDQLLLELKFLGYYEASALTALNVRESVLDLCQHIADAAPRGAAEKTRRRRCCN